MARIVIRCFPAPGFDGVFRAGRKWAATGTEVETIAGESDVPATETSIMQIGTKTMAALEADGRFSFGIAGTVQELETLKTRVVELEAENAALKAAAGGAPAPDAKDSSVKKGK